MGDLEETRKELDELRRYFTELKALAGAPVTESPTPPKPIVATPAPAAPITNSPDAVRALQSRFLNQYGRYKGPSDGKRGPEFEESLSYFREKYYPSLAADAPAEDILKTFEATKSLQEALNKKGYEVGTPDGFMGEKGKTALGRFVADYNRQNPTAPLSSQSPAADLTTALMAQEAPIKAAQTNQSPQLELINQYKIQSNVLNSKIANAIQSGERISPNREWGDMGGSGVPGPHYFGNKINNWSGYKANEHVKPGQIGKTDRAETAVFDSANSFFQSKTFTMLKKSGIEEGHRVSEGRTFRSAIVSYIGTGNDYADSLAAKAKESFGTTIAVDKRPDYINNPEQLAQILAIQTTRESGTSAQYSLDGKKLESPQDWQGSNLHLASRIGVIQEFTRQGISSPALTKMIADVAAEVEKRTGKKAEAPQAAPPVVAATNPDTTAPANAPTAKPADGKLRPLAITLHLGHGPTTDGKPDPGASTPNNFTERQAIEGVAKYLPQAFKALEAQYGRPIEVKRADEVAEKEGIWKDGTPPNRFQWPIDVTQKLIAQGYDVVQHHSLHFDMPDDHRAKPVIAADFRAPKEQVAHATLFGQEFFKSLNEEPAVISRKGYLGKLTDDKGSGAIPNWFPKDKPWPLLPTSTTLVQYSKQESKNPAAILDRPMPTSVTATLIEAGDIRDLEEMNTDQREARYRGLADAIAKGNYELSVAQGRNTKLEKRTEVDVTPPDVLSQAKQAAALMAEEHRKQVVADATARDQNDVQRQAGGEDNSNKTVGRGVA